MWKSNSQTYLRTVAAAVVVTDHAPPAIVFLHARQCQMPTAVLLTESYSIRKPINILIPKGKKRSNLPTKSACVSCVLRNFHLFNLFTQGSTITLYPHTF